MTTVEYHATPLPLIGPSAVKLPSDRANARRLQVALLQAFTRSPLTVAHAATPAQVAHHLSEEWRLLDMCAKELVRLLAARCLEWSQLLEIIRSRCELMIAAANAALLEVSSVDGIETQPEAAREQGLTQSEARQSEARGEAEELREMLRAANERAARAEERAAIAEAQRAELASLPAKVELQANELRACKSLLDAQSKTLVELRMRHQAAAAAPAAAIPPTSPTVLVLLPEEPKVLPASASPTPGPPLKQPSSTLDEAPSSRHDASPRDAAAAAAAVVAEATASAIAHVTSAMSEPQCGFTAGHAPSDPVDNRTSSEPFKVPVARVILEAAPGDGMMARIRVCPS